MLRTETTTTYRIRFVVVLSAVLLFSSGFTPAMEGSASTTNRALFTLLEVLDPFITTTSTHPAPGYGISAVERAAPTSSESEYTSSSGTFSISSSSSTAIASISAIVPGIWDESSKKRSRPQIYVEILELLKRGPMTPFEIAFYARLNHKRCKEYVRLLEREGYLQCSNEDGRNLFGLTQSGKMVVERVRDIFKVTNISTTIDSGESNS